MTANTDNACEDTPTKGSPLKPKKTRGSPYKQQPLLPAPKMERQRATNTLGGIGATNYWACAGATNAFGWPFATIGGSSASSSYASKPFHPDKYYAVL